MLMKGRWRPAQPERENPWLVGFIVVVCAFFVLLLFVFLFTSRNGRDEDSGLKTAERQCKVLHDKALMWKKVNGKPPDSLAEMVAPLRPEDEEDFLEAVPDDPWGHPYVLEVNGDDLNVRSFGPDGKKGTDDDIVYPPRDSPDRPAPQ